MVDAFQIRKVQFQSVKGRRMGVGGCRLFFYNYLCSHGICISNKKGTVSKR